MKTTFNPPNRINGVKRAPFGAIMAPLQLGQQIGAMMPDTIGGNGLKGMLDPIGNIGAGLAQITSAGSIKDILKGGLRMIPGLGAAMEGVDRRKLEEENQRVADAGKRAAYLDSMRQSSQTDLINYTPTNSNTMFASSGIHIKKENVGKFTAYKKRTGKTTQEALHSPNAHVRQMANFARNAAKWNKAEGGVIDNDNRPQSREEKDAIINKLGKAAQNPYMYTYMAGKMLPDAFASWMIETMEPEEIVKLTKHELWKTRNFPKLIKPFNYMKGASPLLLMNDLFSSRMPSDIVLDNEIKDIDKLGLEELQKASSIQHNPSIDAKIQSRISELQGVTNQMGLSNDQIVAIANKMKMSNFKDIKGYNLNSIDKKRVQSILNMPDGGIIPKFDKDFVQWSANNNLTTIFPTLEDIPTEENYNNYRRSDQMGLTNDQIISIADKINNPDIFKDKKKYMKYYGKLLNPIDAKRVNSILNLKGNSLLKPFGGQISPMNIPVSGNPMSQGATQVTTPAGSTQGYHETGNNIPIVDENGQTQAIAEPGEVVVDDLVIQKRNGWAQQYKALDDYKQSLVAKLNKAKSVEAKAGLARSIQYIENKQQEIEQAQRQLADEMEQQGQQQEQAPQVPYGYQFFNNVKNLLPQDGYDFRNRLMASSNIDSGYQSTDIEGAEDTGHTWGGVNNYLDMQPMSGRTSVPFNTEEYSMRNIGLLGSTPSFRTDTLPLPVSMRDPISTPASKLFSSNGQPTTKYGLNNTSKFYDPNSVAATVNAKLEIPAMAFSEQAMDDKYAYKGDKYALDTSKKEVKSDAIKGKFDLAGAIDSATQIGAMLLPAFTNAKNKAIMDKMDAELAKQNPVLIKQNYITPNYQVGDQVATVNNNFATMNALTSKVSNPLTASSILAGAGADRAQQLNQIFGEKNRQDERSRLINTEMNNRIGAQNAMIMNQHNQGQLENRLSRYRSEINLNNTTADNLYAMKGEYEQRKYSDAEMQMAIMAMNKYGVVGRKFGDILKSMGIPESMYKVDPNKKDE